MRRALIGYTGFVGSNLDAPGRFTERYNSTNIEALSGRRFDEVWCAGIQAEKWWANQNPDADWAGICRLLDVLKHVKAERFILISTVDVYREPIGVDEDSPVTEIDHHFYGLHRLRVEKFVANAFHDHHIFRLPGLYGSGLKKNLIFDVVNNRSIDGFHAASTFQFYGLDDLWADTQKACEIGLKVFNVAVAPVSVARLVERLTDKPYFHATTAPPLVYDMQTKYSALWRVSGKYLQTAEETLRRIAAYVEGVRKGPR